MPSTCARPASPSARTTWSARCRASGDRAADGRTSSSRCFDPDRATALRTRAQTRSASRSAARSKASRPSTRTASCAASSTVSQRLCAPTTARPARTGPKPYLSFKLDSRAIDELPPPRPLFEIFVYSPRVEGIHLRGGRVARGGIRWSDRREDFRTEILGLMKAQKVKNAVIVPVGAKGGFVVKQPPRRHREAGPGRGHRLLQDVIRGLLDVTDNFAAAGVVPPPRSCATTATIPISWSRPTRARPPSPTSPTARRRVRLLARRRLRLRRLGRLRPQEDGHHRPRRLGSR